jgi:uncharacterized protein YjbI with pentapeptide repeats
LPLAIVVVMAEGKGTPTPKQGAEARQSKPWTLKEVAGKTVWDWFQLGLQIFSTLVVVLIAIGGWRVAANLDDRQRALARKQATTQLAVEDQRTQDLALQGYLDQMSTLVLEDVDNPTVRDVMRARTLATLETLDPSHKPDLMRFLMGAHLVQGANKGKSRISLNEADLHDTGLPPNADLTGAKLEQANLHGAELPQSFLADASLIDADLSDTNMYGAHLQSTDLTNADLSGAGLENADLRDSTLLGTDLNDADLEGANLKGADGWETQQLTLAMSLQGATMPNGQKYEDWIKDKEGRAEDGKNGSAS